MTVPNHHTIRRPEDRQRSGDHDLRWAETAPACFRSEAFAEDLTHAPTSATPTAGATAPRPMLTFFGLSFATWLGARSH
jgi:hypothetical protein